MPVASLDDDSDNMDQWELDMTDVDIHGDMDFPEVDMDFPEVDMDFAEVDMEN